MSDIFEGEDSNQPESPVVATTPTVPPELQEFVGDGKKYKTVEDALRSVPHAQNYINELKQKLEEAEQRISQTSSTEELLTKFREELQQGKQEQPPTPSFNPSDIEQVVAQTLQRTRLQEVAKANMTSVNDGFIKHFGDIETAKTAYKQLAKDANLDIETLNALASKSPDAVLKLAGIKKQPPVVGKPSSTINTSAINDQANQTNSAKVKLVGASTKEVLEAWRNAGNTVKQKLGV